MAEKVTWMVIKADLQCPCCYKKVKRLLCKFPQIRDQVYDEKKNLVTITVVCCSPEKIRDKICCKGGKVIHSIDILEPPKPKPPPPAEKPKPPPPAEKPKPPPPDNKPKPPPPDDKPKPPPPDNKPKPPPPDDKPKPPPPDNKPKEPVFVPPPPAPAPGPAFLYPVPVGYFGTPCYGIYGPCQCPCQCNGYGRPAMPPPCCDNNCGGGHGHGTPAMPPPCCDNNCGGGYGYGNNRGCCVSRCDYFSEENASGCIIM